MGDPLILPKFELHGDKPHWAVRVAWIAGVALLVAIVGLTWVIMHHRTLEMEARVAQQEAIARVKAEAEAKVAAAVAVAKANREAEQAEKRAAAEKALAEKTAKANAAAQVATDGSDASAKASKASRRSHSGHGGKSSKVVGKSGAKDTSSGKSSGGKPKSDPIDDLLKKMK